MKVSNYILLIAIGFLIWQVWPQRGRGSRQARATAAQAQISSFGTALEAFKVDVGYYPQGAGGLNALLANSNTVANWKGPYLKEIPKDPWGNRYIYQCPGTHNTNYFDLMSYGRDEKPNTADDVTNRSQKPVLMKL